ncbi:hypothetical protein AMTR_s00088p00149930 [Amborella trichopoda]|uniref:Pentacotripeptide-repeat region of PRORP domain-containing protein n=1 Tax=Amborella trichopoda TaxID=13333 RepID=W1NRI8_AMBTC|nr:hypothetical protein AMTR_s00088p00149930 [Amborella trichopoda]
MPPQSEDKAVVARNVDSLLAFLQRHRHDLRKIKEAHALALVSGLHRHPSLATKLIGLYSLPNLLSHATHAFLDAHFAQPRDPFLWNAIIRAHSRHDSPLGALSLYTQMLSSSLYPDGFTFPFAFKACASVRDIGLTRLVHGQAAVLSLSRDGLVGTALVSAYARCCAPEDATKVFDEMCRRDGVAWTALVSAYSMNGWADEAFEAFGKMMGLGCVVDSVTLSSLLLACTRDLWRACRVHAFVAKAGFECYASVCNSLIDAYAKCGAYDEAMRVFRSQSFTKDVVSWNTVIAGLALNKQSDKALAVYEEMTGEGVKPNRITLLSLLPACGEFGCSKTAKIVHESFANDAWFDVEADVVVATALIHMHAKCGNMELARDLFEKLERKWLRRETQSPTRLRL